MIKISNNKIINCIFASNRYDIYINGSSNIILDCEFNDPSSDGIRMISNSDNNLVDNCNFKEATLTILSGADFNTIRECLLF